MTNKQNCRQNSIRIFSFSDNAIKEREKWNERKDEVKMRRPTVNLAAVILCKSIITYS